jgi:hypothetical protein
LADFIAAIMAASGVLFFALGAYVLARNPLHRCSRTFFFMAAGLGTLCYLQMLIYRTWDEDVALLALRFYIFTSLMCLGSFFLLSQDLPARRDAGMNERTRTIFLFVLALLAATLALATDGILSKQPGFAVRWGPGTAAFLLACAALALSSAIEMIGARSISTDRSFRSQSLLLAIGAVTPLVGIGAILLGDAGEASEALAALGFLVVGGALGYLVIAYTLFQLPVVRGADLVSGRTIRPIAQPGSTILFEGKGSELAFETLIKELPFGEKGLVITRLHPDQVRERYPVNNARILWLCSQPGEDRVDPLALTILQNIIMEHMQKHGRSIILLDGIEYLISENHVEKVLRLLYSIRDAVVVSGSRLLVPLDPNTLDQKQLAFIEREFTVRVDSEVEG